MGQRKKHFDGERFEELNLRYHIEAKFLFEVTLLEILVACSRFMQIFLASRQHIQALLNIGIDVTYEGDTEAKNAVTILNFSQLYFAAGICDSKHACKI